MYFIYINIHISFFRQNFTYNNYLLSLIDFFYNPVSGLYREILGLGIERNFCSDSRFLVRKTTTRRTLDIEYIKLVVGLSWWKL